MTIDIKTFKNEHGAPILNVHPVPMTKEALRKKVFEENDLLPVFTNKSLAGEKSIVWIREMKETQYRPLKPKRYVKTKVVNYGGGFVKMIVEHGELELLERDKSKSVPKRYSDRKERPKEFEFCFLYDFETKKWYVNPKDWEAKFPAWKAKLEGEINDLEESYYEWFNSYILKIPPHEDFVVPTEFQDESNEKQQTDPTEDDASLFTNRDFVERLKERVEKYELTRTYHQLLNAMGKINDKTLELFEQELNQLLLYTNGLVFQMESSDDSVLQEENTNKWVFSFRNGEDQAYYSFIKELEDKIFIPGYYILEPKKGTYLHYPNVGSIHEELQEKERAFFGTYAFIETLKRTMETTLNNTLNGIIQVKQYKEKIEDYEPSDNERFIFVKDVFEKAVSNYNEKK
jgi:hypothetical protein